MKPEQMAHILRVTDDAHAALVSALAMWDHHEIGSTLEREKMRISVAAMAREKKRFGDRLAAALKVSGFGLDLTTDIPVA